MKEFVEFLIKPLVDKPDEVQVIEIAGERSAIFELRVGDGDLGKVIGRSGQTAKSLRTLVAAVAAKKGQRFVLEILEPDRIDPKNPQYKSETQSKDKIDWQDDRGNNIEKLLRRSLG